MTEKLRSIGIAEMILSDDPDDVLVAYGLGSCVAICLYDPVTRVGGMLHALLPNAPADDLAGANPYKFTDRGTSLLVKEVVETGAAKYRLVAALWGGAKVLSAPGFNESFDIGMRNVMAAEASLKEAGLRVGAQATGGRAGRTVKFNISDGHVTVRSLGGESSEFDLVTKQAKRRMGVKCQQ